MANNLKASNACVNAGMNAKAALANNGTLCLYNGTQPTDADTAIGAQTLLVTLTLGATAFGSAVAGVLTANAITGANAVATANAQFFRIFKSDGTTALWDGTVGTSGCDLNMNSVAIQSGAAVSITSLTITQPKA